MMDYAHMVATMPPACVEVMKAFQQPDGTTRLPFPFHLPLPDMPSPKDNGKAAQALRFQFAEDHGFMLGVCGMTLVFLQNVPHA